MIDAEELILLDTGPLLHLLRGDALGRQIEADYGLSKRAERPLISVVTVGEILAFARRNNYGAEKRERLNALIRELIVVNIRHVIADWYAEILSEQQAIGRPIGENDTWIAATAAAANATLLTTDRDDFGKLVPDLIKVEIVAMKSH